MENNAVHDYDTRQEAVDARSCLLTNVRTPACWATFSLPPGAALLALCSLSLKAVTAAQVATSRVRPCWVQVMD